MTNKGIAKLISLLNKGKHQDTIFLRPIGANVFYAKVWYYPPGLHHRKQKADSYYFIQNDNKEFVGAVYDMQEDLHWYVQPKHRKQGYLTRALADYIFPHIFSTGRKYQLVTINKDRIGEDNFKKSKGVATKLGFRKYKTSYKLSGKKFKKTFTDGSVFNTNLSDDRIQQMKCKVFYAFALLEQVKDQLETAYSDSKLFPMIISYQIKLAMAVEDIHWDNKK